MDAATLERLRSEAMALSESERADLAYALVRSLDEPADPDVADEWDREISRRIGEIEAGTAKLIDRNELRRRFRERLGRR